MIKPERKIQVISLNHTDYFGGAAKSIFRLGQALIKNNIDYKILCNQKNTEYSNVIHISQLYSINDRIKILFKKIVNKIKKAITNSKTVYINGCSEINESILYSTIERQGFDLLHLNWVVGGFVDFKDLSTLNKPIIASLHDASFFTGICHVIGNCTNYLNECGKCPILNSNDENDISRENFLLKKDRYKNLNITFVSPSKWMAEIASKSILTKNRRIEIIPNGIDTSIYKPYNKKESKIKLNLDLNKKYICFGAVNLNDENKGYQFINKLLTEFNFEPNIEFISFGKIDYKINSKNKVHYFGYIVNEDLLVQIYSSSDTTLVLSKQESFGQTALESIACGTPVVAFKTSGLTDIIDHKHNGYLANPFEINDVFNGINWCLSQNTLLLSENARNKAVNNFDIKITSSKFNELIKELIK